MFMTVCIYGYVCVNGTYKRCDNKEICLTSDMQMTTDTFRTEALGGHSLGHIYIILFEGRFCKLSLRASLCGTLENETNGIMFTIFGLLFLKMLLLYLITQFVSKWIWSVSKMSSKTPPYSECSTKSDNNPQWLQWLHYCCPHGASSLVTYKDNDIWIFMMWCVVFHSCYSFRLFSHLTQKL